MKLIKDEGIKNIEKYNSASVLNKSKIENAINYILKKVDENIKIFSDKFPSPASIKNTYQSIDNIEWTSSFWTGILWLAYELTEEKKYLNIINKQLKTYVKRVEEKIYTNTHDLGFLYSLSCIPAYKLTNNIEAKNTAIKAADLLILRYFEKAKIIQAWGDLNNPEEQGRMIIDCCMNLPLLYWASIITGDNKYFNIAYNHVKMSAEYLIRKDASTFHTFYMDIVTGKPKYGKTSQGFSDNSCWARGQAWAIYGFILSYLYTNDHELIELSKKVANYFLNRLPADYIGYWDLTFLDDNEERDSSASIIACCGLLEISKHLSIIDPLKRIYENASMQILNSLIDNYTSKNLPYCNGLLIHSVYSKPENNGINECTIWGDYFYFEALVRLLKDWKLYW